MIYFLLLENQSDLVEDMLQKSLKFMMTLNVILVVGDTLDTLFISRISPKKWYSLITLFTQYSVVYY